MTVYAKTTGSPYILTLTSRNAPHTWEIQFNTIHKRAKQCVFLINSASTFSEISTLDRPPWCRKIIFEFHMKASL